MDLAYTELNETGRRHNKQHEEWLKSYNREVEKILENNLKNI